MRRREWVRWDCGANGERGIAVTGIEANARQHGTITHVLDLPMAFFLKGTVCFVVQTWAVHFQLAEANPTGCSVRFLAPKKSSV